MASELLKNRALIQRLKEPDVPVVKFDLASTGFEELVTLPEPKPQGVLDIQENVRIQRQQDTMDKARPFLMKESVDFIEREEFSIGKRVGYTPLPIELIPIDETQIFQNPGGTIKGPRTLTQNGKNLLINFENMISYYNNNAIPVPSVKEIFDEAGGKNIKRKGKSPLYNALLRNNKIFKETANKLIPVGEKMNNYIENVMLNPNTDWRKVNYPIEHLAKTFGVGKSTVMRAKNSGKIPAYTDNKKLFDFLGSSPFVSRFKDGDRLKTIGDVIEYSDIRPKQQYLGFNRNTFDRFIIESAFRNYNQSLAAGVEPKVRFIGNPNFQDAKDWKFVYKGQTFSGNPDVEFLTDREMSKNALPKSAKKINALSITQEAAEKKYKKVFPEVFKVYSDLEKYKGTKIGNKSLTRLYQENKYANDPRPANKKKSVFFKSDVSVDHFKNVLDSPFENLRIIDADVNAEAGRLRNRFLNKNIDEVTYNQELDKIGYNKTYDNIDEFIEERKGIVGKKPAIGEQKLTTFQELIKRQGSGIDPGLALKAGFEEFVKPAGKFAGQVARGVGTAADFAISAGPGAKGLGVGLLLEADPIITGMTEGKDFGQTARDTFVGMALDAIPGVNLGSLNEDLIKLADTEEQRVAVQNLIDYQKDYDRFTKDLNAFKSYRGLDQISLEELGFTASDLINMENQLEKRFKDIQTRAPKVYNPDVISLVRGLAQKEALRRKENLEGIQGLIFGNRISPDFVEDKTQQILAASTGAQGATDSYADAYKFLPQEQLTSDELDERFDMEGGIMAANGGRIGFADGPMDPKRRAFMKIMAGIASLPIFSKFIGKSEIAKPVVKIAGTTTKMPDWFPDFVNKMMFSTGGKKVDADIMEYTTPKLPGVKMSRSDDGLIVVEGKNAYGEPYEIVYRPPGYELVDETTGKAVKTPGEFIASDTQYRRTGPEMDDFDVDGVVVKDVDDILGGNATELEGFAKGTGKTKYTKGQKEIDMADAEGTRADVDEGPDIDMSDYED